MKRYEFISEYLYRTGWMLQFGRNPCKTYTRVRPNGNLGSFRPFHFMESLFDMAAKKRGSKQSRFGNVAFVSYKMDAETKKEFDAWYLSKGNTMIGALQETLEAENKISLSYDDDGECYIASMTGKETSLNAGKCLVLRSADWQRALFALAYVHTVVFDGETWDASTESDMV